MTVHLDEKSENVPPYDSKPPVLLILLGASNLSRGRFALARYMQTCLHPRPVEVLTASGPGRGYCVPGGLLTVKYSPIYSSDIFEVAYNKSKSGYQVVALVTDIGNDIMYDVSPERLIDVIQQIFDRLQSMNAEIFYTTLPIDFEKKVHPAWFYILRSLLFPYSRVSYDKATSGIITVNQFLRNSVSRHCHVISDMDRFLGFDEIHYGWLRAHHGWSYVAKVMLGVLGVKVTKKISLSKMLQSYWNELMKVVFTDMTGFKKKKKEHY